MGGRVKTRVTQSDYSTTRDVLILFLLRDASIKLDIPVRDVYKLAEEVMEFLRVEMGIIDHGRNMRPPEHDEPAVDHGRNWREDIMGGDIDIEGFMDKAGDAIRHLISVKPDEAFDPMHLTEDQKWRLDKALNIPRPESSKPKVWTPPPTPFLAVDMAIILDGGYGSTQKDRILLIKRKFPPLGYALPGGFIDVGEECEIAAIREVKEETNLDVKNPRLYGVYSKPDRDPRAHIVSVLYVFKDEDISNVNEMKAGDDAGGAEWVLINDLPTMIGDGKIASKGHIEIMQDIMNRGWWTYIDKEVDD